MVLITVNTSLIITNPMRKVIYLLLALVIITSCKSNQTTNQQKNVANYQDYLEEIGKNSKNNNRLIDVYRAYYILNSCTEMDKNFWNELNLKLQYSKEVYSDGKHKQYVVFSEKELVPYKKKCSLLMGIKLNDKKLQLITFQCINRLQKLFMCVKPNQKMYFRQTQFSLLLMDPSGRTSVLGKYLRYNYDINTFVNLKEENYWKLNDKSNYIKDVRFDTYKKLIMNEQFEQAKELLRKIISETKDFQEQSIYKIQLADQLVSRDNKTSSKSHFQEAKNIYETILQANKYSLYLFESWVKWRSLSQAIIGFSKKDKVPNQSFEKMRLANIKTIFSYLQTNPNDEMAINYFLTLSSHETYYKYENQILNEEEFYEYFRTVNL